MATNKLDRRKKIELLKLFQDKKITKKDLNNPPVFCETFADLAESVGKGHENIICIGGMSGFANQST